MVVVFLFIKEMYKGFKIVYFFNLFIVMLFFFVYLVVRKIVFGVFFIRGFFICLLEKIILFYFFNLEGKCFRIRGNKIKVIRLYGKF